MVAVPAGYDDLVERPLYGHLATTRRRFSAGESDVVRLARRAIVRSKLPILLPAAQPERFACPITCPQSCCGIPGLVSVRPPRVQTAGVKEPVVTEVSVVILECVSQLASCLGDGCPSGQPVDGEAAGVV
jgi:hypothetical protein